MLKKAFFSLNSNISPSYPKFFNYLAKNRAKEFLSQLKCETQFKKLVFKLL